MKRVVKIVIFVSLVIADVLVLYIYLERTQQKSSHIIPAKQNIFQPKTGTPRIVLDINKNQFTYVDKLPFLTVTKKNFSKEDLNKFAGFVGFTAAPMEINDTQEGLTYFWRSDYATLFAYSASSKIRYSSRKPIVNPNNQLSDDAIKIIAKKFLTDSGILASGNFSLGTVQFLKEGLLNEGFLKSTRDDFSLYQINILPKSTECEIISPASTDNINYIQLTKDGSVYSFQLVVFDSLDRGSTEYTLNNYDELTSSVEKSVPISLENGTISLSDAWATSVKEVHINRIDLAYLLDSPTSVSLQPVYKLTGTAILSDGTTTGAILYVSALSGH